MARRSSFTAPGQREQIVRGERTDPRAIIGQATALGLCMMAVIVLVGLGILINAGLGWRYVRDNWRWMLLIAGAPWVLAFAFGAVMLAIEIFDPNWPNPRDATASTRPLMPWSREREAPRRTIRVGLDDLLASLEFDEGDDVQLE